MSEREAETRNPAPKQDEHAHRPSFRNSISMKSMRDLGHLAGEALHHHHHHNGSTPDASHEHGLFGGFHLGKSEKKAKKVMGLGLV